MRSVASRFSPPNSSVTFCFSVSGLRATGTLSSLEISPVISDSLASAAFTVKVCGAALLMRTLQAFLAALPSAGACATACCGAGCDGCCAAACLPKIAAGENSKIRMRQETDFRLRRVERTSNINAEHFLLSVKLEPDHAGQNGERPLATSEA